MILSAISDSSRPDHINQGLWESCCKALGWLGAGGLGGGEFGAGVAPGPGLGIDAAPAQVSWPRSGATLAHTSVA